MASTLELIKNILDEEMEMPEGRVWAYNANVNIPKDGKLFIILSYISRTPWTNNIKYEATSTGMQSHQSINLVEHILISLISQNTDARERAYEAILAMNSYFSQDLQGKNKIHISTIGEIIDRSFLEASSRLNRFDTEIKVFRSFDKIKDVDYYDKFNVEVWAGDSPISKQFIQIEGDN